MLAFPRFAAALAILSLANIPARSVTAADKEITLEPSSPWNLDYGEARCRLGRMFGEGKNKSLFFIEQRKPSTGFDWVFAGPPIGNLEAGDEVTIQFGPGNDPFVRKADGRTFKDFGSGIRASGPDEKLDDGDYRGSALLPSGLPQFTPETGKNIHWLRIQPKGGDAVLLNLGDMQEPLTAMNGCMESLLAFWGLDVEEQKNRRSQVRWTNLAKGATKIQKVYPKYALDARSQADFSLLVIVDKSGKPTKCEFANITTAKGFGDNNTACEFIYSKGKFEPARDLNGNPITSYYYSQINYRITTD